MMWDWSLESGDMKTFHRVKAEPLLTLRLLEVLAVNPQYILVPFRKKASDDCSNHRCSPVREQEGLHLHLHPK